MQTQYLRPNGHARVHLMHECPRSYHLAYIARRHSPYTAPISGRLRRFDEAGLLAKWYELMERALAARRRRPAPRVAAPFAFGIADLQIAFYALAGGSAMAAFVFGLELLCYGRTKSVGL